LHLERSIEIAAPPERVWEVMSDVERWHEWTTTIQSVERLDSGPFALGSRALVRQPRLRPATFEVTALEPGRSFTWVTRSTGLAAIATHEITHAPSGSRVTLGLDFSGLALVLIGWWVRGLSTRYMDIEAEGLKRRAEGG
jgi:carbon monoxide dehydrogenase subunit G